MSKTPEFILFKKDWDHYPNAIVDLNTGNESFKKYARLLYDMGIKNWQWPLVLFQKELSGIDPHSKDLTEDQIRMITIELAVNPIYFFREVARFENNGNIRKYEASRMNMAYTWCFLNHIDFGAIAPRQRGKTAGIFQIWIYLYAIACKNTTIKLVTQDSKLKSECIKNLKAWTRQLPYYLNYTDSKKDADNSDYLTMKKLNNFIRIDMGQASEDTANKVGRGGSFSIMGFDELTNMDNAQIIVPALISSSNKVKELDTKFKGRLYSTTVGELRTKHGEFTYSLFTNGMYWSETLFDSEDRANAVRTILSHSKNGDVFINGTFSHRQLGQTDEKLKLDITEAKCSEEQANLDYLNIWGGTGNDKNAVVKPSMLKIMRENEKNSDNHAKLSGFDYIMRWQYSRDSLEEKMNNTHHLLCVDSSEAGGGDPCGISVLSTRDLAVAGVCSINQTSIIKVGEWLAAFLIKYKNTTLMIEKKSTGSSLLDIVAMRLIAVGEDPFKRIYNRIVSFENKKNEQAYNLVEKGMGSIDETFYEQYKTYFGFNTSTLSRRFLYNTVLDECLKSVGHLVHDGMLIDELAGLKYINGRIDHIKDAHDDLVISWLLGQWLIRYGTNLGMYGIKGADRMSAVRDTGAIMSLSEHEKQKERQEIIDRVIMLKERLESENDPVIRGQLRLEIKRLSDKVDIEVESVVSMDKIKEDVKASNKKLTAREMLMNMRSSKSRFI